jgi:hypothetical protein
MRVKGYKAGNQEKIFGWRAGDAPSDAFFAGAIQNNVRPSRFSVEAGTAGRGGGGSGVRSAVIFATVLAGKCWHVLKLSNSDFAIASFIMCRPIRRDECCLRFAGIQPSAAHLRSLLQARNRKLLRGICRMRDPQNAAYCAR